MIRHRRLWAALISCMLLCSVFGAVGVAHAESAEALMEIPSDYTGKLTVWGWDDTYHKTATEAFNKLYPNVTFEYTPVANGDLLQKYQTALATGTELPDIPWAIVDSRAKVFELDMWEPLDLAPERQSSPSVREMV